MQKPIALTLGEPAGIAPEIAGLAWQAARANGGPTFFLIGDPAYQRERAPNVPVETIAAPERAGEVFAHALPCIAHTLPLRPKPGRLEALTAAAVIGSIDRAANFVLTGEAAAMVTNPIQKETLYLAGFRHEGHTDYLAHLARARGHAAEPVMMLVAQDLRTIPVTVHIPLADVPKALTAEKIVAQGRVVARDLARRFGIAKPRLGVTGLNPHAGENGAMGQEERTVIAPALAALMAEGIDVTGPLPADTAFHAEARAAFDAILCMYHDQALIPVKTLDFHGGVNVTLGLPFIRTSPDHGTALNIAGTGTADPRSLIAALNLAALLADA